MVKDCPGGSEIVPLNLSLHLSKTYAALPPANWALAGPVALWRLAQRNWGPNWRVLRVLEAKISSPKLSTTTAAWELASNLLHTSSRPVLLLHYHEYEYILDMGPIASPSDLAIYIQVRGRRMYQVLAHGRYQRFLAEDALSVRFFSPSYRLSQSAAGLAIH
nr:hypothetical protein TSTRO_g5 [Trichoderma stromaticum]